MGMEQFFAINFVINRGENKNDVGFLYVISNILRTKMLT